MGPNSYITASLISSCYLLDALAQKQYSAIGTSGKGVAVCENSKRVVQHSIWHVATQQCEDVLDVHGCPNYRAIDNQDDSADEWQVGSCFKNLVKMLVVSACIAGNHRQDVRLSSPTGILKDP